eukprot:TRINITY_DN11854_c0_g1_i1.p1 TRINITY_DN11854_c0_g1~~TRINITY_DN11854_c0_g1_i1.p1  ORF type:complete len:1241 (-),score=172.75 TRINITY_DN11854_c0_g1_i1:1669-5391(-)
MHQANPRRVPRNLERISIRPSADYTVLKAQQLRREIPVDYVGLSPLESCTMHVPSQVLADIQRRVDVSESHIKALLKSPNPISSVRKRPPDLPSPSCAMPVEISSKTRHPRVDFRRVRLSQMFPNITEEKVDSLMANRKSLTELMCVIAAERGRLAEKLSFTREGKGDVSFVSALQCMAVPATPSVSSPLRCSVVDEARKWVTLLAELGQREQSLAVKLEVVKLRVVDRLKEYDALIEEIDLNPRQRSSRTYDDFLDDTPPATRPGSTVTPTRSPQRAASDASSQSSHDSDESSCEESEDETGDAPLLRTVLARKLVVLGRIRALVSDASKAGPSRRLLRCLAKLNREVSTHRRFDEPPKCWRPMLQAVERELDWHSREYRLALLRELEDILQQEKDHPPTTDILRWVADLASEAHILDGCTELKQTNPPQSWEPIIQVVRNHIITTQTQQLQAVNRAEIRAAQIIQRAYRRVRLVRTMRNVRLLRNKAALKLTALFRGVLVRRVFAPVLKRHRAARKIQQWLRGLMKGRRIRRATIAAAHRAILEREDAELAARFWGHQLEAESEADEQMGDFVVEMEAETGSDASLDDVPLKSSTPSELQQIRPAADSEQVAAHRKDSISMETFFNKMEALIGWNNRPQAGVAPEEIASAHTVPEQTRSHEQEDKAPTPPSCRVSITQAPSYWRARRAKLQSQNEADKQTEPEIQRVETDRRHSSHHTSTVGMEPPPLLAEEPVVLELSHPQKSPIETLRALAKLAARRSNQARLTVALDETTKKYQCECQVDERRLTTWSDMVRMLRQTQRKMSLAHQVSPPAIEDTNPAKVQRRRKSTAKRVRTSVVNSGHKGEGGSPTKEKTGSENNDAQTADHLNIVPTDVTASSTPTVNCDTEPPALTPVSVLGPTKVSGKNLRQKVNALQAAIRIASKKPLPCPDATKAAKPTSEVNKDSQIWHELAKFDSAKQEREGFFSGGTLQLNTEEYNKTAASHIAALLLGSLPTEVMLQETRSRNVILQEEFEEEGPILAAYREIRKSLRSMQQLQAEAALHRAMPAEIPDVGPLCDLAQLRQSLEGLPSHHQSLSGSPLLSTSSHVFGSPNSPSFSPRSRVSLVPIPADSPTRIQAATKIFRPPLLESLPARVDGPRNDGPRRKTIKNRQSLPLYSDALSFKYPEGKFMQHSPLTPLAKGRQAWTEKCLAVREQQCRILLALLALSTAAEEELGPWKNVMANGSPTVLVQHFVSP